MNNQESLTRLANLLYGLAAVTFAGTVLELIATKHYGEPMQLVPLVLCGAGLVGVVLAWKRPDRQIVQALRVLMALTAVATMLGMWKHIEGNIGFEREMHPNITGWPLIEGALTGGAPLLASGALAVAASIAIAATVAAGWSLHIAPLGGRVASRSGTRSPQSST